MKLTLKEKPVYNLELTSEELLILGRIVGRITPLKFYDEFSADDKNKFDYESFDKFASELFTKAKEYFV